MLPRSTPAIAAAALSSLLLAACSTAYERTLASWQGAPISQLVAAWGPAHERFRDEQGRRVYQWSFREIGENPTGAAFHYQGEREPSAPFCQTRFTVDESGVIRNWAYRGNDCFGDPRP